MAHDEQGFGEFSQITNSGVSHARKDKKRNSKKRSYAYSRNSVDRSVIGLLIAILTVGLCLLCVSVIGMLGTSSGLTQQPPVQGDSVQTPAQGNNGEQTPTPNAPVVNNQNQTPVTPQDTETTTAPQGTENTTVTPPAGDEVDTPAANAPQTDEEWLNFFNTALNKLKSEAPALTKEKQVVTTDVQLSNPLGQTVVSIAKEKFLSEEVVTTPIAKGDTAAAAANISPDGQSYVSTLGISDIKSITHTTDANGNYVITIAMPEMTSPDISGPYGRIFVFLTVDEVMNSYAPDMGATVDRNNVSLLFSDCSATATISPDGVVVAYETTLNINMILKDAKISVITTDVDAKLLSETKYKDIVW